MNIALIAAIAKNKIIGINNSLPWDIPEDLKRFRKITTGHPILMGRKTFESIGRPLPKRTNIILTNDIKYSHEGVLVVNDFNAAKNLINKLGERVFIIGGSSVYKLFQSEANELIITHIDKDYQGDSYFPDFDWNRWTIKEEESFFDEKSKANCKLTIYKLKN